MLSNAKSPSEYLDQLEDDWRRSKLLSIREMIRKKAPQLDEKIHYKMLGYGVDDNYAFHLNVQRAYVSLYVGNISKIDPSGELLSGMNIGKGCIRFAKSTEITEMRIGAFITRGYEMWKSGDYIDC
ncbi:MAG: DUF1801 domain-containing protein [Pseudomonadota bacterium]